ncbi:MAG: nitroreductase family protein [Thermoleophilia bacterium]|nr:nitroreductase family protein [Thermoleophilia bacterium]
MTDADTLLATTRAVRRRLDLTRPVERRLLEECIALAQQAPSGGNRQGWSFVVVTDRDRRAALAELYRRGWERYVTEGIFERPARAADPGARARQRRITASARYLADHLHEVPVLVVPCITGRTDGGDVVVQASQFGSVLPAVWSFMLAARARGLGTAWTTIHLFHEREAAGVLGIPFDEVMQAALIPVAHLVGEGLRPGHRRPLEDVVHWDRWGG